MAGRVYLDNSKLEKPGSQVGRNVALEVRGKEYPWVSRGGLKLNHGLNYFCIDMLGATCLDIGASTGGFTDVLLARGAKNVYAIDVGYGQLDWKLRQDDRVVVLESTNARYLTAEDIPEEADIVVCDASFIGLEKVLPASLARAKPSAMLIALIKPQFQAGRKDVSKGGVVRDPDVHARVCREVEDWLAKIGWAVLGISESPIKGPKGNTEFLIAACRKKTS